MGAGRKTETYTLAPDNTYGTMCVRNLHKGDLCGVIFGCKFSTIKECYDKKLFGLPGPHMAYIKNIDPGLTLFLFNYSDRTLHGIFEAASEGKLNIDPKAWSPNGSDPSPYPAQVKIRVRVRCQPLVEEKFRPVIADNYRDEKMFWFELDRGQTNKLLRLFSPSPSARAPTISKYAASPSRKAIPASSLAEIGDLGAPRVDRWSSLFKPSDDLSENKEKDSKEGAHRVVKTRGWEVSQKSVTQQSGASYSSVVRNATESSDMEKITFSTNEAPSQASKGVENPWSSASRVLSSRQDSRQLGIAAKDGEHVIVNTCDQRIFHPAQKGTSAAATNVIGPSKGISAEDTNSEIDWDAASNFQAHLEGLNNLLEEPRDKDGFKSFEGNAGFASSSSMVPNQWEDERVPWDYEEGDIDQSPCGSSYVSAGTGDALEDNGGDKEKHRVDHSKMEMGSSSFVEVLSEIWAEVKELKQTQMKQAEIWAEVKELKQTQMKQSEYMISLQMELLDSRKEILRLKGRYESS